MLQRSDKRKDRVEISPEQLSMAASEAEISLVTSFYPNEPRLLEILQISS